MSAFRLSLFGPPRLTRGEELTGLLPPKMLALLAYLVAIRRPVHRDELAQLFWPDLAREDGRANLRNKIFHLRKLLGDDRCGPSFFLLQREILSFAAPPALSVDLEKFLAVPPPCTAPPRAGDCQSCLAEMRAAAACYGGEFMEGFYLAGHDEFAEWLEEQRAVYQRHAAALFERLYRCLEQLGHLGEALEYARRQTELDPWREAARCDVMRLLAASGKSAEALRYYEAFRRDLQRELGVVPEPATQALAESLRSGVIATEPPIQPASPLIFGKPERRQITALCCEVAPFAALDDPEEWNSLLDAPKAACREWLEKAGGFVMPFHGSGLLAYFSYPAAREDAARAAVGAALACAGLSDANVSIRVGVHTGIMLLNPGSLPDAAGLVSSIAIALREQAARGQVWVSDATRELVAGYFHLSYLDNFRLGASRNDTPCYLVAGSSGARSRLEAAAQLTPLAGRDAEIARLQTCWESARQGAGSVVLLRGEAGIGKSRLVHALKQQIAGERHVLRELRCFPEFSQTPFYPLITLFEDLLGLADDDDAGIKFGKLVRYVEKHYPKTAGEAVPLLAKMLSLPLSGAYRAPGYSPQLQRERTLAIVLDRLQSLAARQPVLLIVEDLHWIDPSTLELLSRFVSGKRATPVFTVLTTRPEFSPPWHEGSTITLELPHLANRAVAEMLSALSSDFTAATRQTIMDKADGVPLFVEEMARMVRGATGTEIPATLQDLLAARLDSVGEAKRTAQLAATIGREFDFALLSRISPPDHGALNRSLAALQKSGLIQKEARGNFQFRHALIQEAAYRSQAKSERHKAHRHIARALLESFPVVVVAQPELLAQHLAGAGETRQAIEYWIKAGQRAVLSSANLEASGHFNSALQLLLSMPVDQDRDQTEFTILTNLCPVLYATKGYGSEEATQANARLSVLGKSVGDSPESFLAEWAQVMNSIAGIGSLNVPQAALRLLDRAHGDPLRKQAAHYAVANAAFWLGDFATTRAHTEQAIALYHPDQHRVLIESYNEDLWVSCSAYLAWSLYFLGHPQRAQQVCEQMLQRARELDHPHTLALALCFASVLHRWLNKHAETLRLSAETISVSRQQDFSVWLAAGEMTHGWALVMHGQEEGIAYLQSSIAGMKASIGGISVVFLSALIEAYLQLEMYDEALHWIAEAQNDVIRTGDGHYTAELYRLKGECLLGLPSHDATQAEACLGEALATARQQGAKSLELRAATSLANLLRQQGKTADAEELLRKATVGLPKV